METTGKVKRNPTPLEYIKYDGGNMEAIQKFTGIPGVCKLDKTRILISDIELRIFVVLPGMYIVKNEDGKIATYTQEMFEKIFEPWDVKDDIKTFVLRSHRTCNEDECFVGQMTTYEMSHEIATDFKKKKRSEVTKDDHVIRCVICHEPATTLDCHYPYEVEMNRCEKHQHSRIDPCTWSDYGVAVEVCKDHYSMLGLKAKIEQQLDWLDKQDGCCCENILHDKLRSALWQLDHYMKEKWPKEQMGPSKEDEAKTGK